MPEKSPPRNPNQTTGESESKSGQVAHLDQSLWHQLGETNKPEVFCSSWLGLQSKMVGGVSSGAVLLEDPAAGTLAPVAVWPEGHRDLHSIAEVVQRALREKKGVVIRSDADAELDSPDDLRFQLAYPVRVGDRVHGVAVLQITPRPQIQLQQSMRQLQWGVAWLQNWILRQEAEPGSRVRERLTSALELAAVALEEERFQAAATALVTELATRLDCDRVSIGILAGKQIKVHALSHSAQFGKQMNLIRSIGMAMGESLDQQSVLVYPEPDDKSHNVLYAHEQLARAHGDRAVCTVPFGDREGRAYGAITLERSAPEPFDSHAIEICDSVAALAGPILESKRLNDRLLVAKIGASLRDQVLKLTGPRHAARKLVAIGLVAVVLFLSFATGRYRVTAETVLEGEVQRAVVAPYRGFIFDAPVRAGDIISEGDLLARLDDRDLRLEYSRWSSEREQYQLEHRRAMAEGNVAAMKILTKRMGQAEAQLALLDEQLGRARITAPFDGIVVSGDLSQSLGAPVETGQVLFEIAPLDAYRLILQVDERDIGPIRVGQKGTLILTAMPERGLPFTVTRITPVSVTEEGRNYFRVEAELDEVSGRLRPGMEGFGKIEIDRRRLVWIWTHKLFDWFRLWSWSWLP